jgi:phasin family protein
MARAATPKTTEVPFSAFQFPKLPGFEPNAFFTKVQAPFDLEALVSIQRKNVDAWAEASRLVVEGAQVILRRQTELFQQAIEQSAGYFRPVTQGDAQDQVLRQIDLTKKLYEQSIAGAQEISSIATKSGQEAVDLLARRTEESLDELKGAVRKAA